MKTIYTVGKPERDSSYITFDSEHDALRWWREEIEKCSTTDMRRGSVVKKHTFETEAEAETARLNYVLYTGDVPSPPMRPMTGEERLAEQRRALDLRRGAPLSTVEQIWPKPAQP